MPIRSSTELLLKLRRFLATGQLWVNLSGWELKSSTDKDCCICYFEATGELYFWTYDELRDILVNKNPGHSDQVVIEEAISDFHPLPPSQVALSAVCQMLFP